ncbi:MAG: hypothetical protein OEW04_00370 [Nitrospirota bacterium]|nr:hypothetical protein [Nitrospirota bacterium]
MEDIFTRIFENLVERVSGPMKFRLILQPLMAAIFAVRSGLQDAREGRPPYFWSVFTNPDHRRELLQDGWKAVGKVFVIAIILDAVYQYMELRWFYPGEAILVAIILAFVPYLLIRGPVNRLTPRKGKEKKHERRDQ